MLSALGRRHHQITEEMKALFLPMARATGTLWETDSTKASACPARFVRVDRRPRRPHHRPGHAGPAVAGIGPAPGPDHGPPGQARRSLADRRAAAGMDHIDPQIPVM